IGTYHFDMVLDDPAVADELTSLLGSDLAHLHTNLKVRAPIGFSSDCLLMYGSAEHAAESERAYVPVCLYRGQVHAARLSGEAMTIYSRASDCRDLPDAMNLGAAHGDGSTLAEPPPGVTLQRPQSDIKD